jgi:SAM-dependent methyltransferase
MFNAQRWPRWSSDTMGGAGDVAILAANIVGDTGEVVGTDLSSVAVATARARAAATGTRNVSFLQVDPARHDFGRRFDAIVGRYVLMFIPDPATALRDICRALAPGGVVVFHESDFAGIRSLPTAPLFQICSIWVEAALRRSGHETHMGVKLVSTFVAAGLPPPALGLCATTGGGENADDQLHLIADLAVTLMPAIEQHGIATAAEVAADTLFDRMRSEVVQNGSVVVGRSEMGAWTRVPDS